MVNQRKNQWGQSDPIDVPSNYFTLAVKEMELRRFIKAFSYIAVVAGLLRGISSFGPWVPNQLMVELLYICTDLTLILGLLGIYLGQHLPVGKPGAVAFILALLGLSYIAGPNASLGGVNSYVVGAPVVGVGFLLFSWAQLQAGLVPKYVPCLMIVAILLGAVGLAVSAPGISLLSGIAFGSAFAMNGWLTAVASVTANHSLQGRRP